MKIPRRIARIILFGWILALIIISASSVVSSELSPWAEDLKSELAAAQQDGKPLLILLHHVPEVATLDANHWVTEDSSLNDLSEKFHRVHLKDSSLVTDIMPFVPKSGLIFLTPQSELIAYEEIPLLRTELKALLSRILQSPQPIDEVVRAATANPHGEVLERAIILLRKAGRADRALALWRLAKAADPALGEEPPGEVGSAPSESLEIDARIHFNRRLKGMIDLFRAFQWSPKPNEKLGVEKFKTAFALLESSVAVDSQNAQILHKIIEETKAILEWCTKNSQASDTERANSTHLSAQIALLESRWFQLLRETDTAKKKYSQSHPDSFASQLAQLRFWLKNLNKDYQNTEPKIKAFIHTFLEQSMTQQEWMVSASILNEAILALNLTEERKQWARKMGREAPLGRNSAMVYLDLADEAFAEGNREEANRYWQLAQKAAGEGESPALYHTAQTMQVLVEAKNSQRTSRWAKRKILDVVVLVPDIASFAAAISCWDENKFFPVLFQDDLYAPKFITAFKPAQVVLIPPFSESSNSTLSSDTIQRAILASWLDKDGETKIPKQMDETTLSARLKELGEEPSGVVFSDGVSGEVAGAIALAAGRFQGFEFLPVPKKSYPGRYRWDDIDFRGFEYLPTSHSQQNEERMAHIDDLLSEDAAWAMAREVQEGLTRWNLPKEDHWAYITLAGAYPYRYPGELLGYFGPTGALDDLLGRAADGTRLGVVGRLVGNQARSAYQAACSLFLNPESALLLNTYTNSKNPKSKANFPQDITENLWQENMAITHLHGETANIENFRKETAPWNQYEILTINSAGSPVSWAVKEGGGSTDDFPIGGPTAISMMHSYSAANPYDPDTIAGRSIWGGAFWYFGSINEPTGGSFQQPSYYAPRIIAGVPWAAAFRQRTEQPFWRPWRLMMVGDPLFCLREKSAKRIKYKLGKDFIVAPNEILLKDEKIKEWQESVGTDPYTMWLAKLRSARWTGDHNAAYKIAKEFSSAQILRSEGLAMALEEYLIAGNSQEALDQWNRAPAESKNNDAVRIYARQAIGSLMDEALAAKNLQLLCQRFTALLTTGPAENFVRRWIERVEALADEKKEKDPYFEWLTQQIANPQLETYKPILFWKVDLPKVEALYRKEHWEKGDKAEALRYFVEAVKAGGDAKWRIQKALDMLTDAYLTKLECTSMQGLLADIRKLLKADDQERNEVESLLKDLEKLDVLVDEYFSGSGERDHATEAFLADVNALFETDSKEHKRLHLLLMNLQSMPQK